MSCAPSVKSSRRSFAVWRGGRQGSRSSGQGRVRRSTAAALFQAASGCPCKTCACRANPARRRQAGLPRDRVRGIRHASPRRAAADEAGSSRSGIESHCFISICCAHNFKRNVATRTSCKGLGEESWQDSFAFDGSFVQAIRGQPRMTLAPSHPMGAETAESPAEDDGSRRVMVA